MHRQLPKRRLPGQCQPLTLSHAMHWSVVVTRIPQVEQPAVIRGRFKHSQLADVKSINRAGQITVHMDIGDRSNRLCHLWTPCQQGDTYVALGSVRCFVMSFAISKSPPTLSFPEKRAS